jgi:hypothetical protein
MSAGGGLATEPMTAEYPVVVQAHPRTIRADSLERAVDEPDQVGSFLFMTMP